MAKRKRLTPAQPDYLAAPAPGPAPRAGGPLSPAPIAQVAGEAATASALAELSQTLQAARDEGRLIEDLPLEAIDAAYLVRDRMVQDEDEMEALISSLKARGQQTPIEVVALPAPRDGATHGLVSGWRRLTALRRLHAADGGGRFATVRARVIAPENRQSAYVAMVEENEIRADLSHYERARIALRAWAEQVYPTQKLALQGLFGAVSRSKRSKINSFIALVEAFDSVLRFPTAIPEKLGLDMARALQDDPGFRDRLAARLQDPPARSPAEELARIAETLRGPAPGRGKPAGGSSGSRSGPRSGPEPRPRITTLDDTGIAARRAPRPAARFDAAAGRIEITGADSALYAALTAWLAARG